MSKLIVEIISEIGVAPLRIPASQIIIRHPNGTPVSVAAMYGSDRSLLVSHCADKSFQDALNKLAVGETVILEDK
jgi:hypothetical protein